jgi:hypothetical protein
MQNNDKPKNTEQPTQAVWPKDKPEKARDMQPAKKSGYDTRDMQPGRNPGYETR